ncbi:MAG: RHS repeat protein, partial [Lysobacter sp.]|nr:RHS repeat protein [Lysobacter sp.]
ATFKSKLIAGDPAAMGMVRDRVAAIANDARDLRSYQVYDSAGRIAATIDGAGYVSTRSYDAAGRVVQERRHAQAATIAAPLLAKLIAGTASVADIAAVTPVNNATDAVVRHIYDAAGRERYTLVQNSASTYLVSERRYDGAGRVTAQYQYAVPIALGPVATPADVGTALNAAGAYATADRYRSTQYVFDAVGRVRFTVDDLGAVNEQRFDGAGRVVETRRYGGYISISTPMNDAAGTTNTTPPAAAPPKSARTSGSPTSTPPAPRAMACAGSSPAPSTTRSATSSAASKMPMARVLALPVTNTTTAAIRSARSSPTPARSIRPTDS